MHSAYGTSNHKIITHFRIITISFLSAFISVGSLSYSADAEAEQQYILADGETETLIVPEYSEDANYGAFEGGPTGTLEDTRINLAVPELIQRSGGGGFNIPTGSAPSPLSFNGKLVKPFTQKMWRFEEFGSQRLPAEGSYVPGGSFPLPVNNQSGPDAVALDVFLGQNIYPFPTKDSNVTDTNPWWSDIQDFLGRPLLNPPAEGRAPGQWWSHQRYEEFYPQNYVQTAQAGARDNGGLRDENQRHGYSLGEFGPGGLYHNTAGVPGFEGSTAGIQVRFHPDMPLQEQNTVFTFDGTFPPKLLNVRYGEGVLFRHYNALPIDPAANNGFGVHTITTHEHNGHTPAESDGYTNAFFFPGQFYDYRWPIQLAGYDSINTDALDVRAAFPCAAGETLSVKGVVKDCLDGRIQIPGDYRETMSTHWFHDHMLDFTAQNVYKGNAAMMNYYSAIDRGNEVIDDGVNLRFPSGSALGWGNRDYDVNLMISGKAWDSNGQLFFNVFNTDGFLGDRMMVNWLYKPTLDVRARRYRFRLLNASVSRYIKVALVTENNEPVPFHMILNDGNIMEHSVKFTDGILPMQGIAERYDIIVDFSAYAPGTKLYMVNLAEHRNGKGPEEDAVPLQDVLDGTYNPVIEDGEWEGGDPIVGKFLEFAVVAMEPGTIDQSMNPADFEVGGQKMIDLPTFTEFELANATHRTFEFGRSNGTDDQPWTIKSDGGLGLTMDPRRLSAAPDMNGATDGSDVEIWHLSTGGGWSHPIHVHFEEGKVLTRDGETPPDWETVARKDVYRIGPEVDGSQELTLAIRFREFAGTYMEHCHNTQHEDTAMLLRWDIENPGQTVLLPTPLPTWDGVNYVDTVALSTFRSGDEEWDATDPVIVDTDGDGVLDIDDAFPLDASESVDTDGDGIGDNADTDDDNDGVADGSDAFPLDASESVDTDGDGVGNNADDDDDNDAILDIRDANPLEASARTSYLYGRRRSR